MRFNKLADAEKEGEKGVAETGSPVLLQVAHGVRVRCRRRQAAQNMSPFLDRRKARTEEISSDPRRQWRSLREIPSLEMHAERDLLHRGVDFVIHALELPCGTV